MIRRLNFTGRKSLARDVARISLRPEADGGVSFDAELDLDEFDLPKDASVFIEAAFKTTFMRFAWGTVGELAPAEPRLLTLFDQPRLAHFRVKIVEPKATGMGLLLAVADHIEPEGLRDSGKRRVSLFRVDFTSQLTDEIWRLDFDDGGPILELAHSQATEETVRSDAFRALVYPAVFRQVLWRIFEDGIDGPQGNPDHWQERWLRFAAQHCEGKFPPSLHNRPPNGEHEEWIEKALAGFSRKLKLVQNFKLP